MQRSQSDEWKTKSIGYSFHSSSWCGKFDWPLYFSPTNDNSFKW